MPGVERRGVERVDEASRHGRPFSTFVIWFASNLTIADYALGSVFYGLPLQWIYIIIITANLAAGAVLGLAAAMGPKFGYPQMRISAEVYGQGPNRAFAAAQWLSTIGWFSVNVIIATYALEKLLPVPYWAGALIMVGVMAVIGIYGHDVVHHFERAMSIVLGVMFAALTYEAVAAMGRAAGAYSSSAAFTPTLGAVALASAFSYLASWAPYASDYSRYLPEGTSAKRLFLYALLGGAIASAWLELVGTAVYVAAGNPNLDMMSATVSVVGRYWAPVAMAAIVLGGLAANALNLYSNSLSAQAMSYRFKRIYAAAAGAAIGYALSILGGAIVSFTSFYEDFLLLLDYWIMPWIGVLAAYFYALGRRAASPIRAVAAYLIGLLVSAPFMNLSPYGVPYTGPVASMLGGADVSYFVSFAVSFAAYLILSRG